ncbi:MAG: M48 family metalloprotease [Acidobacteria bacterium]|nr:M48 family metalloprotease [Acidobacteriota bacterium]
MRSRLLIPALMLLIVVACSTNPATGKRELSLISQQQELAIGAQAHQDTLRQFGVYDEKPEINRMVDRVGQRIAAVSDRPDLEWTFTVLDSPMLNAMALPGGYVYITRGMLERMNTEDELAGVLAHEIAHVTNRHAAQRISQAQLAQLGLVAGAIIAGPEAAQQYGDLAQLGASLLFQRYSRQQETQSDLFGTAYMAEAGYNPHGAEQMLRTLDRLRDQEASSIDQYFQSHPDPAKRVGDVQRQIAEIDATGSSISQRSMDRGPFISNLEGMITGRSTERVTVKNNTVYEKTHGMVLSYPASWEAQAGFGGVFQLVNKNGQGSIQVDEIPLERIPTRNVQNALRQHFQQMGLKYQRSYEARAKTGQRFVVDLWAGQTRQGTLAVETTHFENAGNAVVFIEISPASAASQAPMGSTLAALSFDQRTARAATPPRLKVGQAGSGDTWSNLARRATGDLGDANEIAAINGFDAGAGVPRGLVVKLPEQIIERD